MMRFVSFSSGSCGNCSLLLGPHSGILIDAGVGIRRIKKELEALHLGFDHISAILVTHEHGDHIRSLGSFCKRVCAPVWTTPTLHEALLRHPFTRDWVGSCRQDLQAGVWNPITEDHTTDEALQWASQASTVVIESNYDLDMLMGGSYPQYLKDRISHGIGHLSNEACAAAIPAFLHPGLRNLFLCHLSGNNNTPDLAYASARAALEAAGVEPGTIALRVLHRGIASPLLTL